MSNWDIPPIPARQFAQQFSSFLISRSERSSQNSQWRWQVEPRLHRNLAIAQQENEFCEDRYQAEDTAFFFNYFLDICQDETQLGSSQTLARWHLAAFLEVPCYYAARDRARSFRDFKNSEKTWEEYLYIAQTLVNTPGEIERIHRNYNSQITSLESHFQLGIASSIRDIFHKQTGRGKYSIWYSIKQISTVKLKEKLQDLGESPARIDRCLEARKCLFEVYSKSDKRWQQPTAEQYREGARFCSRHCFAIAPEDFQQAIKTCRRALQSLPKISYLGEEVDTLEADRDSSQSIGDRFQTERAALNLHLNDELANLETERNKKAMLLLRFGLELSGALIANLLNVNQSTISRQLSRLQRELLQVALDSLEQRLEIDEVAIASTQNYIELWLQQHYQQQFNAVLRNSWRDLDSEQRELLSQRYFQNQTERAIAQQHAQTCRQIRDRLAAAKEPLILDTQSWVETTLGLVFDNKRSRLERAIEKWLKGTVI